MPPSDTQLLWFIERAVLGDESARSALLDHACDRLRRLTRKMFHSYPDLRRWEQTDDVFQQAMLRLCVALEEVKPESVRHFFNLAALMVRRTLLDLAKRHFGPNGIASNHHTDRIPQIEAGETIHRLHDPANEPNDLEGWSAFHLHVGTLPDEEQEVVHLLFYEGLTQEEAAKVLEISLRTLNRRWQSARCRLHEALNKEDAE